MAKVVGILNQKGGVGKTTLAVNLARTLEMMGDNVLLVDTDPQGSARDWHAAGNGAFLKVVGLDRPTLDKDIKAISQGYDWIILDGAPQLANMAVAAIKCCDFILVPVQPSPYDIWASEDLVELIKERQKITDGKPGAAFIISRQITNTTLGNEIREAISGYEIPVLEKGTFQRIVYAKSAAIGSTVIDFDSNGDAAHEMQLIAKELKEKLQ